jgi:hypothetical protein
MDSSCQEAVTDQLEPHQCPSVMVKKNKKKEPEQSQITVITRIIIIKRECTYLLIAEMS